MSELARCLAALAEAPTDETARIAELVGLPAAPERWEYTAVFREHLLLRRGFCRPVIRAATLSHRRRGQTVLRIMRPAQASCEN